ncbi:MAG: DUF1573 domain-containing protein [Saprospiraceae bacterium]
MKNSLFFLLFFAFVGNSCKNDNGSALQENKRGGPNSEMIRNPATANMPTDTNQLARISFEQAEFDFGTVNEGTVVEHTFKFANTGKVPLTILKCRSSCGCTVPEWPEEPIPPGGTGEITAKFNTEGKTNEQKKSITVTANTYPNESKVLLKGIVNPVKG